MAVSNDGASVDSASLKRLFKPFVQADTGATRGAEGLGMGLYVVSRLVEVHGGSVDVRSDDGWVTVEVRLVAADGAGDVGGPRARRLAVPARPRRRPREPIAKVAPAAAAPSSSWRPPE